MKFKLRLPKVTQINDHIWLLNDNDEATCYVVAGTKKAMVIDTMVGLVDVKKEARKLTDLPLILINTHGHCDHIGGNWAFDEAYLNPADNELAREHLNFPEIKEAAEQNHLKFAKFLPVHDGEIFDLGDLSLQAYELPGHTHGEIVLIDRKDRILFSGDGIIEQIWMQLPESLKIRDQAASMRRLEFLRPEFDHILHGHSRQIGDAQEFDELLKAAEDLAGGNTNGDVSYEWFRGTCMAHPYGKEPRRIVYRPEAL